MNDLLGVVDWSRAQFAMTAMYHWLFVPLTIGLSLIVAIMESIYVRTGDTRWRNITKFWMTLFGINFACGVATGIILEFEFGTNWSNYSWFVGDIFGAPLAIEGIVAFFMEATFVAVMFFGWNKVSRRFHLASTWLTAIGVSLSALWILVANAWMQNPVGMTFDPAQMRNVMTDFWAVAFNPVSMNKFFHAVTSGWALAGAFVLAVSCWLLARGRNADAARKSIRIGGWVGTAGLLLTCWTGPGSAVQVARVQPMKLAAMEGLYTGGNGVPLVAFGILNSPEAIAAGADPMKFSIDIPYGLSLMIDGSTTSYVPGIEDLLAGRERSGGEQPAMAPPYSQRMEMGVLARQALTRYSQAREAGDSTAMAEAEADISTYFPNFGYGYLESPDDAVPPVGLTFYSFHVMVLGAGLLVVLFATLLFAAIRKPALLGYRWMHWLGFLSLVVVYLVSQAGWIVAEVGRQPWVIQNLMPTGAAISDISSASVQTTFWIFAVVFTGLLVAEISIMTRYISKASRSDIETAKHV